MKVGLKQTNVRQEMKKMKDHVGKRQRPAKIRPEKLHMAAMCAKMPSRKVQRERNATARNMHIQTA